MKLLRTVIKGMPDAALAASAAPDIATAGTALLAKCGVATTGVLCGVLNGTGVVAGGLLALSLFVVSRCIANKERKEAEKVTAEFAASLKRIESQLHALGKANDRSALVELLQTHVTASLPDDLKNDADALIQALFAQKIIDRVDELDEKLTNALGDVGSRQALMTVLDANALNPGLRQKIELALKEVVADEPGTLFKQINQIAGYFQPRVFVPVPLTTDNTEIYNAERLRFYERLTPTLVGQGRQADLKELRDFLEDERPLAWWLRTGEGGEGKSRLALEFLYQNYGPWRGGFVQAHDRKLFPDLTTWTPTHNTLFIIDYVAGYSRQIAQALEQLQHCRHRFGDKKVRVLLLERYYLRNVTWATELESRDRLTNEIRYGDPKSISRLEPRELVAVFREAFQRVAPGQPVPEEQARRQFEENVQSRRNRPLYAVLLAFALSEGKAIKDLTQLDAYALEHEARIWNEYAATSCDVNVALYATMMGGTRQDQIEAVTGVTGLGIEEPDSDRLDKMLPRPESSAYDYEPVQPDLLGEAFVAARLRGEFPVGGNQKKIQGWAEALLQRHIQEQTWLKGSQLP